MKIQFPKSSFVYYIFSVEENNEESLRNKLEEFYTIAGIKPKVSIGNDLISIEIDSQTLDTNEREYRKLISFCEAGQLREGLNFVRTMLESNPNNSDLHRIKGQIESDLGNPDEAIDSLIDALRWDPKNVYALIMMGNIFARDKNDTDTALIYYRQASEIDPDDNIALNNIGGVLLNEGRTEEAKEFLFKAEKGNDDYPNTKFALGLVYFKENNIDKAFEYGLKAVQRVNIKSDLFIQIMGLLIEVSERFSELYGEKTINDYLKFLEGFTEKRIEIEESETIETAAKVELAEVRGRDFHKILYNPTYPSVYHLILHELIHIDLAHKARIDGQNLLFISSKKMKDKFKADKKNYSSTLNNMGFGKEVIESTLESLFNGINSQIFNTPIDLFIEDSIYNEFPHMRPIQFTSLYNMVMNGIKAVTDKRLVELGDKKVISDSKILNLVLALHFKELYGVDLISNFKASHSELNTANGFYYEFGEYRNDKEAGEEYELIQNWGKDLKLDGYFELINEQDYTSSKTFNNDSEDIIDKALSSNDIYTDEEMESIERFQETHGKEFNPSVMMYMVGALEKFDKLTLNEIKQIAQEIAIVGMSGISPEKQGYLLQNLPNEEFSGYRLLAYYYVSWAIGFPDVLDKLQLPFDEEYKSAKKMFNAGN